jgi:hypothetical protein
MSEGSSHTTVSVHPGQPVRVGVCFFLDGRAWIAVPGAGTEEPHLHLSHGEVSVSICPCAPGRVTAEDARIARELAVKAAEYAAEIERLHAASTTGQDGDAAA